MRLKSLISAMAIQAERSGTKPYASLVELESVFKKFDTYEDAIFPDLSWLQLANYEWDGIYYDGYGLFKRTEPSGFYISGNKTRFDKEIRYTVSEMAFFDRFFAIR